MTWLNHPKKQVVVQNGTVSKHVTEKSDNQIRLLGPSSDHQRPDRSDTELKRS